MPIITESDFNLQIKSKNFQRAYFIYGEEKYLVDYYTEKLTGQILSGNNNSFNLQDFSSLDFDVDMLNNAVEALPLMSPIKCVRVFNLDVEKEDQSTLKKVKNIISDIPDTTVFIISQKGVNIDKRPSAKWSSFLKFFEKYGAVLNLTVMNKAKLQKQLIKWADKLSCNLSESNAQKIIDKCGENLLVLKQEMEKLCAYANRSEITSQDIDDIIVENLESNIFDLTKAIMSNNYKKAFEIIDILLYKKEEPIAILSVISSVYIDMYRVKTAEQSGKDIYELTKIFDYKRKEFRLENAKKYIRKMSIDSIRECINLIADTDAKLKSLKIDGRLLLEELIVKISRIS